MYLLKFGNYTFPATLRPSAQPISRDLGTQSRPRGEGVLQQGGRREGRSFTIAGALHNDNAGTWRTDYEALVKALDSGEDWLYFGYSDRRIRARFVSLQDNSEEGILFGFAPDIQINFESAKAYFEATSAATAATLTASGGTATNLGDAPALPAWTITIDDTGTGPLTLTNNTTGEVATIGDTDTTLTAGDVIVLNRDGYSVKKNGTEVFGLLDKRIPSLASGNNTITLAAGGTATVLSLAYTYTARYQ